jgi:light-harvesting complex II chlorophyll a/b binding protein 5
VSGAPASPPLERSSANAASRGPHTAALPPRCRAAATAARVASAAAVLTRAASRRARPRSYGYDPLGLGKDAETLAKYRANELLHARWAMLAAAGILIPEGLEANGANITGGTWFETGAKMLNGGTLNYFAVPWGIVDNPLPLFAVVAVNTGLMGAVEFYRRNGAGPAGYSPGIGKFDSSVFDGLDSLYPGGPFDPLGLADDPEVLAELKVKEIKNGRLAMFSVLAFAIQGYVTGEGPYANFTKHIADPFGARRG